jgi:diguanylate cyclase (GGDEF)-like protein
MDGVQVCREVRKRVEKTYTYILLLTAKTAKQDIIEGLEAGADDYLTKPFDAYELEARLNVGRRILNLQNDFLKACEELRIRATHDALTGVKNRGAILELLDQELTRSQREGQPLGIIMADLDHFKRINDTHGHPAGDAVLREASSRMRAWLRVYDTVGRYGGEEFLILSPGCTGSETLGIAERLREAIADTPVKFADKLIPMTLSLGVAVREEGNSVDATTLLHVADQALYKAKHSGRNRVEVGALSPSPSREIIRPMGFRRPVRTGPSANTYTR